MAIHVSIDGYDSFEQIGLGGMAAVYRARQVSIDKTVAIKVLFPYLATDESYIERFQREARAAASIQHENIVNVTDFGRSDGAFYIVMEYYDGRTLEELMEARPVVPTDVAVQVLLEVALGLEAAHARDIVHRDVKPGNIIYTHQGGIKIADFGLARKSDAAAMITEHGKVIGTPAYMSPEQAAGRPVGPASDIFSLGVVAYELLGRRRPFEGRTHSEVLEQIQTHEPPSVMASNPLVVAEVDAIVRRMLAKNERERYDGAAALVADLEAAMEKNGIARDRRRLATYIRDPDAYDASFSEKTIAQCLSRGAFFMQKGQGHLDDAAIEFRRILYLDPGNERARRNIERIRAERGDRERTVTIDALRALPGSARTVGAPGAVEPAERPRRGVPKWVFGAGASVIVVALALAWASRRPDGEPRARALPPGPGAMVSAGAPADTARADSGRVSPLPGGAGEDRTAQDPPAPAKDPTTMDASTVPSPAREAGAPNDSAAQVAGRQAAAGETRRAEVARATGTLTVYFLGGVGELWVDGRPFAHQPPFEGVSMPAGTYRVSCLMSTDAAPREFAIAVRPGAETVIEYEVGGEPVVTVTP
jgi:hypothetical protein